MNEQMNEFLLEHDVKTNYPNYVRNKYDMVSMEDFSDIAVEAIILDKSLARITPGKIAPIRFETNIPTEVEPLLIVK